MGDGAILPIRLAQPFRHIQLRALQLKRVHAASLLLKRVLNIHMTARKLRAIEPLLGLRALPAIQQGTATAADLGEVDLRELSKAADNLREAEALLAHIGSDKVATVEVVAAEVPFLRQLGDATRQLAAAKLREVSQSGRQAGRQAGRQ